MKSLKTVLLISLFLVLSAPAFAFADKSTSGKYSDDVKSSQSKENKTLFDYYKSLIVTPQAKAGPEQYCKKKGGVWTNNKCIMKET